jgi:hypothetical protein
MFHSEGSAGENAQFRCPMRLSHDLVGQTLLCNLHVQRAG